MASNTETLFKSELSKYNNLSKDAGNNLETVVKNATSWHGEFKDAVLLRKVISVKNTYNKFYDWLQKCNSVIPSLDKINAITKQINYLDDEMSKIEYTYRNNPNEMSAAQNTIFYQKKELDNSKRELLAQVRSELGI